MRLQRAPVQDRNEPGRQIYPGCGPSRVWETGTEPVFTLFSSIDKAAATANTATKLAARSKFVAERMTLLLSWQVEMLVADLAFSWLTWP